MRTNSVASSTVKIREDDPTQRYEDYIKKWKISTIDGRNLTSSELREEIYKNTNLKELINTYEKNKTDETAKALIDAANSLPPIKVSYASDNADAAQDYLNDSIRKGLIGTENALNQLGHNVLTKNLKNNFENQKKLITQTRDFLEAQINDQENKGRDNQNEISFNKSEVKKHERLLGSMDQISSCFDEDKTTIEKKDCLQKQKRELYKDYNKPITLDNLKLDVMNIKEKLTNHNNIKPFKDFIIQKALVVNEINKKCNDENYGEIFVHSSPICNAKYNDTIENTKTIEILGDDAQNIVLHLQNDFIQDASGAGLSSEQISSYKAELKNHCKAKREEDKDHIQAICDVYKEKRAPVKTQTKQKRKRKVISFNSFNQPEEESGLSIFAKSFGLGLLTATPDLASSWMNYDATKTWRTNALQSIQYQNDIYLAQRDYYNEYMIDLNERRLQEPEYMTFSNFGQDYINPNYNFTTTFQGANAGEIYSNTNDPLQFMFDTSFAGSAVLPNSTATPTTPTTTSPTSFNFDI
jgi:hypothetical protein